MSRIGKKPITITKGVTVNIKENTVEVNGPKGKLAIEFDKSITIESKDNELNLVRENETRRVKALHGLTRALIQNMIIGVTEGYSKKLELVGIGYKAEMKNDILILQLGYSHPIVFKAPPDIKIEVPVATQILISGIDKQLVGLIAAKIRSFRPPEPYKGKGVKYENEHIRRKAGKTAAK